MKHTSAAIAVMCLLLVTTAHAASFDCRQARHPVEKIVCANSDLSKLDDELAAVWCTSQAARADPTQMCLHSQQAWMADIRSEVVYYTNDKTRSRADAEKAYAIRLLDEYRRQIDALRQQTEYASSLRWTNISP